MKLENITIIFQTITCYNSFDCLSYVTQQKQNPLQDKQIKQLANYLNLTMHEVDQHSEMLYEMDTKTFIMNSTLQHLMWNVDTMRYESNILHYFQTRIYRVHTSLYAL